jgi:glycosyltransferase involved in cell wall biosynthesis
MRRIWPDAPVFTSRLDAEAVPPELQRDVVTSFLQRLPASRRLWPYYVLLCPLAFARFDLRGYDLVLSSASFAAKNVRAAGAHLCYCYTPPRFLWGYERARDVRRLPPPARLALRVVEAQLRRWDLAAAQRADTLVAISQEVRRRIRACYHREAQVIYPPLDTQWLGAAAYADAPVGSFFLVVSRLLSYKRIDLAVAAFNRLGWPLVIIGDGPERQRLERMARPNVRFLGFQPDSVVAGYLAGCRAFVFPGREDFGLAPLEALACGRPVVAYAAGGVLEFMEEGVTGELFPEQSVDALIAAVQCAATRRYDPAACRAVAARFAVERFCGELQACAAATLASQGWAAAPDQRARV